MTSRTDFLKPEVRCGFAVTAERKKMWKVTLDLLETFIEACDRHNWHYKLGGGSMLGAVRHGGFIPWDDDIDVDMLREDYDEMMKVLPNELPSYYFLQTTATDQEYGSTHAKLRDCRTSAIPVYHGRQHLVYNMGAFLDIVPVDGCPDSDVLRKRQAKHLQLMKVWHACAFNKHPNSLAGRLVCPLLRIAFCMVGKRRYQRIRENIQSRFPRNKYVDSVCGMGEFGFRFVEKAEWSEKLKNVPFEYLKCYVPIEAEGVLTRKYGNWREFVKGTGLHGEIVFDWDKDYKTKLIEEYGYKPEEFAKRGL